MTQLSALGRFAISPVSTYCPGLSTVVSLAKLFHTHVSLSAEELEGSVPSTKFSPQYVTHLKNTNLFRSVILLVPVLGNIVVAVIDLWNWRIKQALIATLQNDLSAFHEAAPWLKEDEGVQAAAAKRIVAAIGPKSVDEAKAFYFGLDEELLGNAEVAAAVIQKGVSLDFSNSFWKFKTLWTRKPFVLLVVAQNGAQLVYASDALKKDEEVALAAVKQNGFAVSSADETLRNNRDFWLKVLAEQPKILIPEPFCNEQEFMLEAIRIGQRKSPSDGKALPAISSQLRGNLNFMLQAIAISKHVFYSADQVIQKNPAFIRKALEKHPSFREDVFFMQTLTI